MEGLFYFLSMFHILKLNLSKYCIEKGSQGRWILENRIKFRLGIRILEGILYFQYIKYNFQMLMSILNMLWDHYKMDKLLKLSLLLFPKIYFW